MPDEASDSSSLLWHYTGTPGLLGILQGKKIWATDALYLNDSRELIAGLDLLKSQVAEEVVEPGEPITSVASLWLTLRHHLGAAAEVDEPGGGTFVSCFCSERDLLSQWRNYANGSGFAIGFTEPELDRIANAHGGKLVKVEYLPAHAPANQELLQRSTLRAGGGAPRISVADEILASFKHEAFREECETRIVVSASTREEHGDQGPLNAKFREGRLGLTPYITLDVDPQNICEVMIGPGGDQRLRRLSLERFLSAVGCPANVSISAAPFRG